MAEHLSKMADEVFGAVRGYVARSLEIVLGRIDALEKRAPAKGEPGEKGDPGEKGADAAPVDMAVVAEQVREAVKTAVDAAVAQIPPAKDGLNGKDADPAHVAELVKQAVAEIPPPPAGVNGKDADPEFVRQCVAALLPGLVERAQVALAQTVQEAVKALPAPKDGVDGKDANPAVIAEQVKKAIDELPKPQDGRDGRDGEPGRDAIHVEVLDGLDTAKRYQRGTYANFRGGVVRSFRATDPIGPDGIEKAGWQILIDGDAEESFEFSEDGRTFVARRVKTSGRTIETRKTFPLMIYRGVFSDGRAYEPGDTVTWGGSLWHCNAATESKPGTGADWQLVAKKGRDGADGELKAPAKPPVVKI